MRFRHYRRVGATQPHPDRLRLTGDSDTIEVCTDRSDVVSESSEENNCKENRFEQPAPVPVLTPPGLVALIGSLMIVAVRRVKKDG